MLIFDLDKFFADRVIGILTTSITLKLLTDTNIFINDIDFTQNLTG